MGSLRPLPLHVESWACLRGASAPTHVCTDTYMLKQVDAHSNFSSSLQTSPHCQINCLATLCTQISSSIHPVLSPPPALLLLQPHRCASGCAKPYTLPLHPPSSVDAPHEDNPLGSPPRPKPAPEGDDVTLKKPSLTQQHPSLAERLPQPSHPAHTSPFVLFSCSH